MDNLRRSISADSFDAYFKGVSIRAEEHGCATVLTPTRHACDYLEKLYKPEIADAIRAAFPQFAEVQFVAAPRSGPEPSAQIGTLLNPPDSRKVDNAGPAGARQSRTGFLNGSQSRLKAVAIECGAFEPPISPLFRLENFENGVCNRIACATAQTVVETPGTVYCPLFIYGASGLGKTHLLQGIAQSLAERAPGVAILYTSCEAFVNGYITAVQSRSLDAFRARYRSCDALIMEDIQFLANKVKTQEELLHTVQFLRGAARQIVFSANCAPGELARIDKSLIEVLCAGLSIKLECPEFELRVRLLHALAKRRNWTLEDGAARVLATHVEKSVSLLDAALCKTIAVARANGVAADCELALNALRDLGYLRNGPPTLNEVLDATAKALNVNAADILSSKRVAAIVHARHVAIYKAKHMTSHTVAEIGRFFGNRDHSTVLATLKKMNELQKREETVRQQLQEIQRLLGR